MRFSGTISILAAFAIHAGFCGQAQAQAQAPAVVVAEDLLEAATLAYLDRGQFLEVLTETLPGFVAGRPAPLPTLAEDDPFFWSISGRFGASLTETSIPGGIVGCARYGLAVRDRMTGGAVSDPATFALMRATRNQADDGAVWPEIAVARLSCDITWDDDRRVVPIAEPAFAVLLAPRFAHILRTDGASNGANTRLLYGFEGYRLDARGGPGSAAVQIESFSVDRRVTHQRVSFRSFLLGGGV